MGSVKMLDRIFNLNRGPYSPGGSFHTVCPYSYRYRPLCHKSRSVTKAYLFNSQLGQLFSVIPTGISGIPASDYYCDQTELYLTDNYRPDVFSTPGGGKCCQYRIILMPPEHRE
jgi:penicillin G amidase